MPSLVDIHRRQARTTDSLIGAFEEHLRALVARAQARVVGILQKRMVIEDGVILQTPGNMRVLRKLNDIFIRELDAVGYPRLVEAFVGEFRGQLTYLQDTMDYLSEAMKTPLKPLDWTEADRNILAGFQQSAAVSLESAMETAAATAMTRSLFTVGGLPFGDLVQTLAEKYNASIARARTLADTGMSVFYRTASDRAFQHIEGDLPEQTLRYRYVGPDDLVTRPFCHDLLARTAETPLTRDQIDDLNNGQIPNVWFSGGGWSCRHTFLLDTRHLILSKAA